MKKLCALSKGSGTLECVGASCQGSTLVLGINSRYDS